LLIPALSNPRDDAAKLKWDGVRCLFEDAQSEILLLIDSCAVRDAPLAGSHGAKQAIAAYTPDQMSLETGPRSFTATLADTLRKLSSSGQPFNVQKLYDDVRQQRQHENAQALARLANGPTKPSHSPARVPAFFTLTPAKGQGIVLVPLDPRAAQLQSPPHSADPDPQNAWKSKTEDRAFGPEEVLGLVLDEQRVLVCTTFVGDASPDMTFFNQWLHNMPPTASKITVEGMFLGPPTMLLISMPLNVWNIVQHDKVCCFLGHIGSHNMIHLYQRLVASHASGLPSIPDSEDGRALKHSPAGHQAESGHYPCVNPPPQGSAIASAVTAKMPAAGSQATSGKTASTNPKDEGEDSAEMKEAAEQLKALSHVRHLGDDTLSTLDRQGTRVGDSIAVRHAGDPGTPPEHSGGADGSSLYDTSAAAELNSTPSSAKPKARKPLQKHTPKQEVRCEHCSHAPFKDSSSLRKHVAAAHTRPFPCAFSFAGCTSTFGSKNEWKRHIASQHLCLTYYRCSSCPQQQQQGTQQPGSGAASDGTGGAGSKGNEFNRKDLFTQHLRRMHAPLAIKKALTSNTNTPTKGSGSGSASTSADSGTKLQAEWDAHVKTMQASCLVVRRKPPQRSACPRPGCSSVFEGAGAWDEWTEHVGRHMEKGEAGRMGVDRWLAEWAVEEGIIEVVEGDGSGGKKEYRLCPGNGLGSGGGGGVGSGGSGGGGSEKEVASPKQHGRTLSDGGTVKVEVDGEEEGDGRKQEQEEEDEDDDPSITVAIPVPVVDSMDVD
jgi:hypothetical protein